MQVILLRDVSGIGQKGQIRNVSDGHALNYLIPNRLAEMATPDRIKAHEKQQADDAKAAAAKDQEWQAIAKKIDGARIEMRANASPQGHLYEKISGVQLSQAIREQLQVTLPPASIEPKMAMKEIGEWPIEVRLGSHAARLIAVVART